MYQFCIFRPSKKQRLEDFLGSGARHWCIVVLNPCLEDLSYGGIHPRGFTHDVRVEVSPYVKRSEPSEPQERIDVRSGSTH